MVAMQTDTFMLYTGVQALGACEYNPDHAPTSLANQQPHGSSCDMVVHAEDGILSSCHTWTRTQLPPYPYFMEVKFLLLSVTQPDHLQKARTVAADRLTADLSQTIYMLTEHSADTPQS